MVKTCLICNKDFETNYPNKKYCSNECSREAAREADKLRKRREYKIKKNRRTVEEEERIRLKRAEIEKEAKERAKQEEKDLKKRLKQGDPKAKMQVAKRFSLEYWEAYKEVFEQDYYNRNYTEIINDIDIRTDNAPGRIVESIKELGRICTRLVRLK